MINDDVSKFQMRWMFLDWNLMTRKLLEKLPRVNFKKFTKIDKLGHLGPEHTKTQGHRCVRPKGHHKTELIKSPCQSETTCFSTQKPTARGFRYPVQHQSVANQRVALTICSWKMACLACRQKQQVFEPIYLQQVSTHIPKKMSQKYSNGKYLS